MAQRPRGRHTQGAVREMRINAATRPAGRPGSHAAHAAAPGAYEPEPFESEGTAGYATGVYPSQPSQKLAQNAGKHARRVPGVGDVIERTPREGEGPAVARVQMRAIADPDETVRIPPARAEERMVVPHDDAPFEEPAEPRRDSLFGRHLFLFSFAILAACWYAYGALTGFAQATCDVTGAARMLFAGLRGIAAALLPDMNEAYAAMGAAYVLCDVAFACALRQMRRTRMPWGVVVPCLAFYCLFPLWGPAGDFGGVLCAACTVLLVLSGTMVLVDGRSAGSWVALAAAGSAVCFTSDLGVSIAAVVLVAVFLWLLARCGQSRKEPEQLLRADGTTWRAKTQDSTRRRLHEQARFRRIAPQKAVGRAFVVAAVVALVCVLAPSAMMPVAGANPPLRGTNLRALMALLPLAAWFIAGGVMLYRNR